MSILSILILILLIISALLLITVVLLQDDSGEGLAGLIGGGSAPASGPRSANFFTHLTSGLAAIFIVSALALAWLNRTPDEDNVEQAARALEGENAPLEWWNIEDNPVDVEAFPEDPSLLEGLDLEGLNLEGLNLEELSPPLNQSDQQSNEQFNEQPPSAPSEEENDTAGSL